MSQFLTPRYAYLCALPNIGLQYSLQNKPATI